MSPIKTRFQYIIDKKFQIKYISYFLIMAASITTLYTIWSYYYINTNIDILLKNNLISSPDSVILLTMEKKYLFASLLKIFIFVVLFSTLTSIFITHRLAGPMFALKRKIKSILSGEASPITELKVRKTDEFKDVVEEFNKLIEHINKAK